MPTYNLECVQCHNTEEKLFTCIMNFLTEDEYKRKKQEEFEERSKNKFPGFKIIGIDLNTPNTIKCQICEGDMVLLPSLPAMQPDKYWSGQMVHGQYTTSGSFVKRYEKQNNLERVDRSILEEMHKKRKTVKEEVNAKNRANLGKFLEKELASVEISNDGNTVKEQNKFNKVRQ